MSRASRSSSHSPSSTPVDDADASNAARSVDLGAPGFPGAAPGAVVSDASAVAVVDASRYETATDGGPYRPLLLIVRSFASRREALLSTKSECCSVSKVQYGAVDCAWNRACSEAMVSTATPFTARSTCPRIGTRFDDAGLAV